MKKAFLLSLILAGSVLAQAIGIKNPDDKRKEIHKTIAVNNTVRMNLDIHFANVYVESWDKPEADILITISTEAKSEERANELMENIQTEITEGTSEVGIAVRLKKENYKGNENYTIDVRIHMPLNGSVQGSVTFGNIEVGTLGGPFQAKVEYGNLQADELNSTSNSISCGFGNADIGHFGGGSIKSQYGNVRIDSLQGKASLDNDFGNVDVEMVAATCQGIQSNVDYGNVRIHLSPDTSFNFDTSAEYGNVKLPEKVKLTLDKKDYTRESFSGTIGSGGAMLQIHSSFGNIEIDQ